MVKSAGRNMVLSKAGTAIGGVKALSIKLDATPIDITDNDSNGIQELLAGEAARKMLTITVSGILTDNVLRALAMAPGGDLLITDLTFTSTGYPTASDVVSGDFFMTNYEDSGAEDGAVEFSATFTSSGDWAVA